MNIFFEIILKNRYIFLFFDYYKTFLFVCYFNIITDFPIIRKKMNIFPFWKTKLGNNKKKTLV